MIDPAALVAAIDSAYNQQAPRRGSTRIGASSLGNECDAFLALSLRGAPDVPPDPALKRIFAMGHFVEPQVIKDLRAAGLNIIDKDPLTGRQTSYEAYEGHVVCRLDGMIEDGREVVGLEVKSMNRSMWTKFKSKGLRASHPEYMAQVTAMMGMSGLRSFLVVAYCKDHSQYWAELIPFDVFAWNYIKARIERVMKGDAQRIASIENDWRCDGCFKKEACWGHAPIQPKCSMCKFSLPAKGRRWYCTKKDADVTAPCSDFEVFEPKPR